VDEDTGPIHKSFRKRMSLAGYEMHFWSMTAETHGAALSQDRLMVVCTREGRGTKGPIEPIGDDVPPRSMSNLRMPTGVPHQAWFRGSTLRASKTAQWWPCEVRRCTRKLEPIFDHHGLMPDRPGCWIQSERGTRRLQAQELAKGKGVTSDWFKPDPGISVAPLKDVAVRFCTGIHIWTAVLDATLEWLLPKEAGSPKDQTRSKPEPRTVPEKHKGVDLHPEPDESTEGEEWTWEAPDLRPGSEWYCARISSLKQALQGMAEASRLLHRRTRGTGYTPRELHRGGAQETTAALVGVSSGTLGGAPGRVQHELLDHSQRGTRAECKYGC
jgi:hypothetical protein